jgi:carboxyl-terminal processing protease
MKSNLLFLIVCCSLVSFSCTEQIIGTDPPNTPSDNFNVLWKDYDLHYARFTYKNVNWDSLYSAYYPLVHQNTTDSELFSILSSLLGNLKDSHAVLESPFKFYQYFPSNYVSNFNFSNVKTHYIQNIRTQYSFTYGQLAAEIGYIHIATFENAGNTYLFIDNLLSALNTNRGVVIDVRNNGGGSDKNARTIAGRFADTQRLYCTVIYRNGAAHDDFTAPVEMSISPEGSSHFSGRGVLLTNRSVGSAAEDFVLMMRVLPNITVVGDTTSGTCGGGPITRELPNGWLYRIPTNNQFTAENKPYEGIGIEPDTAVWISRSDELQGKDTIIEKALEILSREN